MYQWVRPERLRVFDQMAPAPSATGALLPPHGAEAAALWRRTSEQAQSDAGDVSSGSQGVHRAEEGGAHHAAEEVGVTEGEDSTVAGIRPIAVPTW